jgi:hypothetical protein
MFIVRLVFLPVKVGAKLTSVAAKTGYRTGRLLGYRRLTVFGIGVAVGLLVAPVPGRVLREKLQARLNPPRPEPAPIPSAFVAPEVQAPDVVTVSVTEVETIEDTLTISGTNGHG